MKFPKLGVRHTVWFLGVMGLYSYLGFHAQNLFNEDSWMFMDNLLQGFVSLLDSLASGFGFLGLTNREIAAGLGYAYQISPGHPLSVNFDYANMHLESTKTVMIARSMTLGLSFGF